jgi:hypothetical protein
MPTYVPNFQNDIFVSYAHVDDQPLPGGDSKGWITTFIRLFKISLAKKLGRQDAFSLWMDYELRGNQLVTPDIDNQIKNSATFIFILSNSYLASHWCRLEFHTFVQQAGIDSGRLFMIEHEPIAAEDKLPEFTELLGYSFWIKDSDTGRVRTLGLPKLNSDRDVQYYEEVDRLAKELADKLKKLKKEVENPPLVEDSEIPNHLQAKIARLRAQKTTLENQLKGLAKQHSSITKSLQLPLPKANAKNLSTQLEQLETEMATLEEEIVSINNQLQKLGS